MATDGYTTAEDFLIIEASKVSVTYILLEIFKAIGPMITGCLFLYRFRVHIHSYVFFKRYEYS